MEREEVPAMQNVSSLSSRKREGNSKAVNVKQGESPHTPDRSAAESAGRWAREANNSTLGWTRNSIAAADRPLLSSLANHEWQSRAKHFQPCLTGAETGAGRSLRRGATEESLIFRIDCPCLGGRLRPCDHLAYQHCLLPATSSSCCSARRSAHLPEAETQAWKEGRHGVLFLESGWPSTLALLVPFGSNCKSSVKSSAGRGTPDGSGDEG